MFGRGKFSDCCSILLQSYMSQYSVFSAGDCNYSEKRIDCFLVLSLLLKKLVLAVHGLFIIPCFGET